MNNVHKNEIIEQLSMLDEVEPVELLKENEKISLLCIGEDESLMEGNLLEIPFVSLKKDAKTQLKMEHYWLDSNKNERGIIVKGSVDLGVPSMFEFDVLMGLFRLYSQNQNFMYDNEKKCYDMPREINFTFSSLAKAMGYDSCSSWFTKKIDEALTILLETTIYNTGKGAMYDPEIKEYIIEFEGKKGFHIFDEYSLYTYRGLKQGEKRMDGNKVRDKSKVTLSSFFHHSMSNKYFKIMNSEEYFKLENNAAKKLYGILNKWTHGSSKRLKYQTLYTRLGLDLNRKNKDNNRIIKNALEDMVRVGFLKGYETERDGVLLYFSNYVENKEIYNLEKYNTDAEIICTLRQHGLSYDEIQQYCPPTNVNVARKVLRLLDNKINQGTVIDIKKFIIAGLIEKYEIDNKYLGAI